jgi:hypothetical protein
MNSFNITKVKRGIWQSYFNNKVGNRGNTWKQQVPNRQRYCISQSILIVPLCLTATIHHHLTPVKQKMSTNLKDGVQLLPWTCFPLTVHIIVGSGSPSTSHRTITLWYSLAVCTISVSTNLMGSNTIQTATINYKQLFLLRNSEK